ncbi:hypothetical protein B0H13DRAFT_2553919 [Mycena leptocephala]|nr:hypothetical protein B0H13DRAFT_2553919 [Mycena leptocephala]
MPPLTRTDTHASIFSWWSDSNSLLRYGPTINLHAVAKPLMRWMYHRQALDFIRKNEDSPLSTETLEIYWSYFPWDFVSSSTKDTIVRELTRRIMAFSSRVYGSKDDAQALVDSPVFHYIWEMLRSPDPVARSSSSNLLDSLAKHECTIPHILEMRGCEQLVALLDDQEDDVIYWATRALATIGYWLEGAQAMVDAKVQDYILKLLKSQGFGVKPATCQLLARLANHEPTVPAILELNLLKQLVVFAGSNSVSAMSALYAISQWPAGVAALADLDISELHHMNFPVSDLPKLLDNIAQYKAGNPDSAPEGMSPAAQTTPSLQGPPRSPVLIETKPDIVINKGCDATFQKITMSSNKCWKGFVGKVGVLRDSRQLKTQWDVSLGIYKKLVPLIKFTGGGADVDEEPDWEDKDAVDNFLKSRAAGGHDIEGLSAKKIPCSSADTLSDIEGGLHNDDNDDGNDTDDDIVEVEKPGMPATPTSTIMKPTKKGIAADPREVKLSSWDCSKPALCAPPARVKKEDRLQGLNNYLEGRVRVDEQAMKLAKADAEFKRLKAAEGMVKEIVTDAMGLYGEETKDKACRVLEKLMDAALNFNSIHSSLRYLAINFLIESLLLQPGPSFNRWNLWRLKHKKVIWVRLDSFLTSSIITQILSIILQVFGVITIVETHIVQDEEGIDCTPYILHVLVAAHYPSGLEP